MKTKHAKFSLIVAVLALLAGCGPNAPRNQYNPALPPGSGGPITNAPGGQTGPVAGCIGIDQRIPFNGNSIYVDSHNIFAGHIPGQTSPNGTVTVGGSTGGVNYGGESMDGLLQMGFTYIQSSGRYNTTGLLMISPYAQEDIRASFPAMQQICVTGVAFDLGYYGTTLYGSVYLYFNNGSNGYMLVF